MFNLKCCVEISSLPWHLLNNKFPSFKIHAKKKGAFILLEKHSISSNSRKHFISNLEDGKNGGQNSKKSDSKSKEH